MAEKLAEALGKAQTTADFNAIVDDLFAASLGIVNTRALLTTFTTDLGQRPDHDLWIEVGTHTLELLNGNPQTASSLIDQAATLRELVASGLEAKEDWRRAAAALAEIPLDSSQRRVPDEERVRVWIRIVRNYLEVDDSLAAGTYLNKLKNVIHDVAADPTTLLHFRLSQARIDDANRKFLAASQAYHEISFSHLVAEDDRLHTLAMAIKCAILEPAGPSRSSALGRLYKDERSAGLEEHGILEKMFLDRLLSPAEVKKFAEGLQPHQLALTADGSTVLDKAVVEHNLLSASRLYSNITFEDLGVLLGLNESKAEDTTARMIEQGRLQGVIDQMEGRVYFEDTSGINPEICRWDANIRGLAEELENAASLVM